MTHIYLDDLFETVVCPNTGRRVQLHEGLSRNAISISDHGASNLKDDFVGTKTDN